MAIKGKRKGKARSGRVVTPGPRPAYVQPKVPLFQRTGAKFAVALIVETLIFALIVGFGEQSQGDRQRREVEEFTSLIQAKLSTAGTAIQALPTGALILPELGATLGALTGEDPPSAEDVSAQASSWTAAVTRAADGIAEVQVPEDLEPDLRVMLLDARNLMERGLRIYSSLAKEAAVAAAIEGDPQQDLITTTQEQITIAGGIFDSGYSRLQEARRLVDLTPVTGSPAPGGILPGGIPGGIPPAGVAPGSQPGIEVPVEEPADGGGGGGKGGGGGGGKGGGGNG